MQKFKNSMIVSRFSEFKFQVMMIYWPSMTNIDHTQNF